MIKRWPILLTIGVCLTALPAWADRPPSPDERAKIEQALRSQGFVSWQKIELEDDDGLWEVDDARTPDGKEFDLKLQPGSLRIVRREPD